MRKSISKIIVIAMVLALSCFVFAGCGGGGSSSGDGNATTWILVHEENEGEYMDIYAKYFAEEVSNLSDGTITVDVYPNGTLSDTSNIVEVLQNGTANFAITDPGWVETSIPQVGVFSLHFFFPSDMEEYDAIIEAAANGESEGFAYIDQQYENLGITNLHWMYECGNSWTTKTPVKTPEDFKGMKFRTMASSVIADSYKAYGADAVTVAYAELYSALQLGTVDGQVNPDSVNYTNSFYEVTGYLSLAYPDSFIGTLSANSEFYASLSDEQKEIVNTAAANAYEKYKADRDEMNKTAVENMSKEVEVIEFTDEMRAPFKEIAEANRDSIFTNKVEDGSKIIDLFEKDFKNINGK